MEEIDKLVKRQRVEYILLWGVAAMLLLGFETGVAAEGIYAGNGHMEYILETSGVLVAIALIPVSLKLFNMALVKRIRQLPLLGALCSYRRWSEIRLLMLALVVWGNLLVYYLTLNNIGGLCALMGLTATLFCWPGVRRVMVELDITDV